MGNPLEELISYKRKLLDLACPCDRNDLARLWNVFYDSRISEGYDNIESYRYANGILVEYLKEFMKPS